MKNWGLVLLVVLAAAYLGLASYGKYRRLREDFEERRKEPGGND